MNNSEIFVDTRTTTSTTAFVVDVPVLVNNALMDDCSFLLNIEVTAFRNGATAKGAYLAAFSRSAGVLSAVSGSATVINPGAAFTVSVARYDDFWMRVTITPGNASITKFATRVEVTTPEYIETPPNLSSLFAWYDIPRQGLSQDSQIATLTDFSGVGNHVAKLTSAGPLYKTPPIGRPVAYDDGTSAWRLTLGSPSSQPFTMYFVVRSDATATQKFIVDGATADGNARLALHNSSGTWNAFAGSNLAGGAVNYRWQIVGVVFNGASSVIDVDGVEVSGNTGANTCSGLTILASNIGDRIHAGMFAEGCIWQGALDANQRGAVRAYLKRKWGRYFMYPFTLPNIWAWYTADVFTSDPTTSWPDAGGRGLDLVKMTGSPTLERGFGGAKTVRHDGRAWWQNAWGVTVNQPLTVNMILHTKTQPSQTLYDAGTNGSGVSNMINNYYRPYAGTAVFHGTSVNDPQSLFTVFNGAASSFYALSVGRPAYGWTNQDYGTRGTNGFSLASNYYGAGANVGDISDVLIAAKAYGDTERAIINAHAARKYGIIA